MTRQSTGYNGSVGWDDDLCLEHRAHIVEYESNVLQKVLTGQKQLDSYFSKHKCIPYDSIDNGDTIYLKETGGPIVAKAKAEDIIFYANLNSEKIKIFKYTYSGQLCVDDDFWDREKDSSYATVFKFNDIEGITPIPIEHEITKPWVILTKDSIKNECVSKD